MLAFAAKEAAGYLGRMLSDARVTVCSEDAIGAPAADRLGEAFVSPLAA